MILPTKTQNLPDFYIQKQAQKACFLLLK